MAFQAQGSRKWVVDTSLAGRPEDISLADLQPSRNEDSLSTDACAGLDADLCIQKKTPSKIFLFVVLGFISSQLQAGEEA